MSAFFRSFAICNSGRLPASAFPHDSQELAFAHVAVPANANEFDLAALGKTLQRGSRYAQSFCDVPKFVESFPFHVAGTPFGSGLDLP